MRMRDYLVVVAFVGVTAVATIYLLSSNQPLLIQIVTPIFRGLR